MGIVLGVFLFFGVIVGITMSAVALSRPTDAAPAASKLATPSGDVTVNSNAPPGAGYTLLSTSATDATWQILPLPVRTGFRRSITPNVAIDPADDPKIIPFPVEIYNFSTTFSSPFTDFVPPVSGFYSFSGYFSFDIVGTQMLVLIIQNPGSIILAEINTPTTSGGLSTSIAATVYLDVTTSPIINFFALSEGTPANLQVCTINGALVG